MKGLGMLDGEKVMVREPVLCKSSRWLRTVTGGLLETKFKLYQIVEKGQILAVARNPFGEPTGNYAAPDSGVVIGMATNPAAAAGTRFCHLGIVGDVE
jgi:predicted deacylase